MFHPQSYGVTLALMIVTMIAWGSWANTLKMVPRYPFQLFYWDYVLGVLASTALWGLTLGSVHGGAHAFLANLHGAGTDAILFALLGGIVFNVANLLLVAAIAMAGLAVAFPVGIGLALVIGVVINYLMAPGGNPFLLFGGMALVLAAIVVDALAYKARGEGDKRQAVRGLTLALASGVLMGSFYPLVVRAQAGPTGLGPYAVAFVFAIGVLLCALPVNAILMRRPLTPDPPVTFAGYRSAPATWHLWGVVGGAIWGTGMSFSLVAAGAALVGPAIAYAVGQGATMVSAAWGVFVWGEFANAPPAARRLILPMFVLFLVGLSLIAIAPLYGA